MDITETHERFNNHPIIISILIHIYNYYIIQVFTKLHNINCTGQKEEKEIGKEKGEEEEEEEKEEEEEEVEEELMVKKGEVEEMRRGRVMVGDNGRRLRKRGSESSTYIRSWLLQRKEFKFSSVSLTRGMRFPISFASQTLWGKELFPPARLAHETSSQWSQACTLYPILQKKPKHIVY